MSYVLRWFNPEPCEYWPYFEERQKDATRFDTAALARASVHASTLVGADGLDDTVGWKVLKLVPKKVRK